MKHKPLRENARGKKLKRKQQWLQESLISEKKALRKAQKKIRELHREKVS